MLSSSEVMVTDSAESVLVTTTVKVTLPPGSGIDVGLADFWTAMPGMTSVIVTVASSSSQAWLASSSLAHAVTVSVCAPTVEPTSPVKSNVQLSPASPEVVFKDPATTELSTPTVPYTLPTYVVVTASAESVLVTTTVNVTFPPGSAIDVGFAVLSTVMLSVTALFTI